jgi:hypothetical protein
MAIDTAAKRFSAMNLLCPWRGVAVVPTGTIGAAARQTVRWLYSGILAQAGIIIGYYADMNTRLRVYLVAYYGLSGAQDLSTLTQRYLDGLPTGDRTQKMQQLINDATGAMS